MLSKYVCMALLVRMTIYVKFGQCERNLLVKICRWRGEEKELLRVAT